MFKVLKSITKSKTNVGDQRASKPKSMSANLQRKFSRGVQYNVKIVIKGEKRSGKTSLFRRLQGKNLEEEYKSTEEIQVANVPWNYKNVDDVVKVEVWDVVDKGRKIPFEGGQSVKASLDAEFVDVYKGTNGVILVMDITKNWTFTYVQNEIPKIPPTVPILILGNRCDMGHHQKIPEDAVRCFIDSVQRAPNMAQIMYTESSMVNGFGLKYIYKFLALPFLHLQRSVLTGQLDRNAKEIRIALQEIEFYQTSEEADYTKFSNQLTLKRRKKAEDLGVNSKSSNGCTPSVIFGLGFPINRYAPFQNSSKGQVKADSHQPKVDPRKPPKEVLTVEEFVPDEEQLDETFFRDSSPNLVQTSDQLNDCSDSDSQEDSNPLVEKFQEDVDSNDKIYEYATQSNATLMKPEIKSHEPLKYHNNARETAMKVTEYEPEAATLTGQEDLNPEEPEKVKVSSKFDPERSTFQTEGADENASSLFREEAMEPSKFSESNPKKRTQSVDKGMGERKLDVSTKGNGKSKGGKHLRASDAGPSTSSKSQRKQKKLKEETRTSKKKMKNPKVFQLKE